MNKADCFHLGYIAKLHGFKGEVSLFLDVTNPEDYASLDALFIDLDNHLTPFFVTYLKLKNKGFAQLRLEGVEDEDAAKRILRRDVYLPAQILPELEGVHFYDHEVVGYKVFEEKYGEVGVLGQVVDLKTNPLLLVISGETEVLIPLIEGAIKKVDRELKELHVSAPDGLIEMYLG